MRPVVEEAQQDISSFLAVCFPDTPKERFNKIDNLFFVGLDTENLFLFFYRVQAPDVLFILEVLSRLDLIPDDVAKHSVIRLDTGADEAVSNSNFFLFLVHQPRENFLPMIIGDVE